MKRLPILSSLFLFTALTGQAQHFNKTERVYRFHKTTIRSSLELMASLGVGDPTELRTDMLRRRVDVNIVQPYSQIYEWLEPGQLVEGPPRSWEQDWTKASPDSFAA